MPLEIERKFRVSGEFPRSESPQKITQGYLCSDPERTVRVRSDGEHGYITIKGIGNDGGVSRFEWEKQIPLEEATDLFKLCTGLLIKLRHRFTADQHIIEIDEFQGDNLGLVIAEIELNSEHEAYPHPDWMGREVTGQLKYYNSKLMERPYCNWPISEKIADQLADISQIVVSDPELDALIANNLSDLYEE